MSPNEGSVKLRFHRPVAAWLALPLAFVILGVAIGIESAPTGDDPGCHQVRADDDHCDRLTNNRSVPGANERESGQRVTAEIERDLTTRRLGRCSPQCSFGAVALPGADEIRTWLVEAGHEGAVVRTTTVDDPAPAGSIVYAVRVGSACVVSFMAGFLPYESWWGRPSC